jgi:hypothetical protein
MLGFTVIVGVVVSFSYLTNLVHYSMKLGNGVVKRPRPTRAGLVQYPSIQHP